jgi:signal transduction histidine kinase
VPSQVPKAPLHKVFSTHSWRVTSLLIGVVMIIFASAFAYFTQSRSSVYRDWVVHTYETREEIHALHATLNGVRSAALLAMLTQGPEQIAQFNTQVTQLGRITAQLKSMTTDNPDQQDRLAALTMPIEKQVAVLKELVNRPELFPPASPELANALASESALETQDEDIIDKFEAQESVLLQMRLGRWNVLYGRSLVALAALFATAIFLVIYNFRLVISELNWRREREELDRQNLESYRALSARILELQDNERRRIARDLHDSIGQFLSGMKLNLGQLRRKTSASPEAPALLTDTLDLADRAIGEVRTLSHLLHPPLLDELGFESAARWYLEGFAKRSGIKVVITIAGLEERLPREVELALFRVLQESLTNVHRHAQASEVLIDVNCSEDRVVLVVTDNGRGIPPEVLRSFRDGLAGGIGLAGMRERLAELSGILDVDSSAQGTTVRATLPTFLSAPTESHSVTIFNS